MEFTNNVTGNLRDFLIDIKDPISKIIEMDYNKSCISENFRQKFYHKDDNHILITIGEDVYQIDFILDVSWDTVEMGDGITTPYESYDEDTEIEIEITNVEDYDSDIQIELDNRSDITELENWIISKLGIT